jgi:hypothetical protein
MRGITRREFLERFFGGKREKVKKGVQIKIKRLKPLQEGNF